MRIEYKKEIREERKRRKAQFSSSESAKKDNPWDAQKVDQDSYKKHGITCAFGYV